MKEQDIFKIKEMLEDYIEFMGISKESKKEEPKDDPKESKEEPKEEEPKEESKENELTDKEAKDIVRGK